MNDIILVVDDEQDIADLIEVYLLNENYTVFKYYSAKEALACIESTELDLAILDIMMPDINEFELCRKIREHHTYMNNHFDQTHISTILEACNSRYPKVREMATAICMKRELATDTST